ncbi:MAG: L,D-transpeptidase family protein, partial [Hyphomicrobiaceae bacterium]|nr:L,D-transpeptidase family protein [Hyphomicrobiaceae bacterium]
RRVPSKSKMQTGRRLVSGLIALGLVAIIVTNVPVHAATHRYTPPQPSGLPWISAQTEQSLVSAVDFYQRIVTAGGWPKLPGRVTLRPGDSDESVVILRKRLKMTRDLPANARGDYAFDDNVVEAVKRFQRRNGLEPTGVVYGITLRSLNVPAKTRLRQLQANLARIHALLPKLTGSPKYIIMNSASFELQGIQNGRVAITSRVISGKRATPTPDVSAQVRAINILPYWHVPRTIAKRALIPAIRKNPSYLYKERIRVFSTFGGDEVDPSTVNWWGPEATRYVFRQDPGPQNALGVLRFDMPNKHIVYMHDTPMKNLFGYFERAYSAGCVRLQNFLNVADWLIAGQGSWTTARIQAVVASGKPQTIKLAHPVPVHFIYLTAWVTNGVVEFRNDLYNLDDAAPKGNVVAGWQVLTSTVTP